MGNRKPQFRITTLSRCLMLSLAAIAGGMTPLMQTNAQTPQHAASAVEFNIPAGELAGALDRFAEQSGLQVVSDQSLQGIKAPALRGRYAPEEALRLLLQGSGFGYERLNAQTLVLKKRSVAARPEPQAKTRDVPTTGQSAELETKDLEKVTVTGTRIRGGSTPSPVITIGSERIQEEGFTNLGEVIRSVPQNFRGGQNPGVIGVSGGQSSQDLTGGSALNLRGLGPDASLTLLNGRRLAYDGFSQAVDISAIPVEAVDRLEIVPDGSSAIYGSDAVGGVGNVILVRDFEGAAVGTRYGGATDGGLATREYTVTAGTTWDSGGLIITFKDTSVDPINAHQRSYTDHLIRPYTIYNGWDSRNGLVSFHQSVGDVAELQLDMLRTDRETMYHITQPGAHQQYFSEASVAVASPSIEFFLPHGWSLTVGGAHSENEYDQERYLVSAAEPRVLSSTGIYNKGRSFEIGSEGPLFAVGGGDARLAVGLGSRTADFLQLNRLTDGSYGGDERVRYAYTELNVPFVSPSSDIAGIRRLELSAAIRGEDYDSFDRVTTPKIGVVYSPNADVTLKATWGKSFKAPTLSQRHLDKTAYLWSASATGGSGYASDATVLMSFGGNPDLEAERARTWTTSLMVHPEALPGFEAELTVFDIDYTDRVVEPIRYQLALSNPAYSDFVDYSPTPEQQAELLAVYNSAFYNLAGIAYDPDNVVAIVRDQYVNAARQRIRGIDLSGSYGFDLGNGRLTTRGSASWLTSKQQTTSGQPERDLAGTAFNPAKFNGRVGAVWASGGFSASGFLNHASGITIQLPTKTEKTASFTTIDTMLSYDTGERTGMFSGIKLGLSVQNALNREPPLYTPPNANYVPYDATNYSAIGRFVSVSVSKRW